MPRKKAESGKPSTGYSHAAKTVLQEGTSRIQEMHNAIAGKSFDTLKSIPLVGLVRQVHDAISGGVYAAIRQGGGSLLDLAGAIESHRAGDTLSETPSRLASSVRSALNAAFGDHLADTNSVLAIPMSLQLAGRAVLLERDALVAAYQDAGNRLCLFVHGLGCDEHCWENGKGDGGIDMPRKLAADTGYTTLALRYNTGLPISENGNRLAELLDELLAVWPCEVGEVLIIGHSMGGLVARSACTVAAAAGLAWLARTRMVICLGSPHLGAPLERLGELTTSTLRLSNITEPLARVAAQRSQGIQDLRHGTGAHTRTSDPIAWRFVGGSLTEDPDSFLGRVIGDGLVMPDSATAHDLSGDVQSVRLGGLGHMELLNDARVYAQIRDWVTARL